MVLWLRGKRGAPPPPLFIGATGGSGTRALTQLLEAAGVFFGADLNPAGDAMLIEPFLGKTIERVLSVTHSLDFTLDDLPEDWRKTPSRRYRKLVDELRQDHPIAGGPLGVKNPRSMFLLPVIHAAFPEAHFLHVVRDGRDMAFSPNQNQMRRHHEALFGTQPPADRDPLASIRMWSTTNVQAAAAGTRLFGARYQTVRLEDLCAQPLLQCEAILRFVGLDARHAGQAAARIHTPASFGRHREQPTALIGEIEQIGAAGLQRFGYLAST